MNCLLASIGPFEIVVVLVVALLVFGGRLPEVSRSFGKAFIELKRGFEEAKRGIKDDIVKDVDVSISNPVEGLKKELEKDIEENIKKDS